MANFTIAEYSTFGSAGGVAYPFPQEPPLVQQPAITTSTSSQASSAFNVATRMIRITTDGAVRYRVGSDPTATQASSLLASGQTMELWVTGGDKIAVIDDA